ncbi:DUF2126 domain-containing protein [Methylococcus sp. EFPC2]|uniref:transglutaminase family protein n=1 Tax=Methylococcus sp. EFPC2 TaxID=2812648 RepID=UPI001966F937|nr:transglutaminase family protein [Methylococcus sp. EFPC2]QSA96180.1 transglutaminase family protein [Methylococcus sp. EFPC2]
MTIRVAIHHQTVYRYDSPVMLSPHVFRLRPAAHSRTPVEAYALKIEPAEHFINWQQDPFGNYLARVVFPKPTRELSVEVNLVADMTVINPFDFFLDESAEHVPFDYDERLGRELAPYLEVRESGPRLTDWLARVDTSEQHTVDFLVALNRRLREDIDYSIRMEPGVQTCEETLERKLGSCRDSAWLLVQIARHLGLAARFVSGYLVQLTADLKSLDGPSGPEQDFTDLHAWTEIYVPGAGWIGLDPTSGLFAGEGHIPLACTPDPVSAAPVTGGFVGKAECEFGHANLVRRIHEDPRVTKPYSEEQWAAINVLGERVDHVLSEGDVRLTLGGEPTFVSIDDMDSPQWNTAADGPHKRERAGELIRRLRNRFGPGGVLHYGQGKWYPGEPLPRWSLGCFWRGDGVAIWRDDRLLADETQDYGVDENHARNFAHKLALRLGLSPAFILPGYEDSFYYLWKEGALPLNVDPLEANLKDAQERRRLARLLDRGLNRPAGYALPLTWNYGGERWQSSAWHFRREVMYLLPGDSPMGYRLPLDSIPHVEREHHQERSLFEERPALGNDVGEVMRRYSFRADHAEPHPEIQAQEPGDVRGTPPGFAHTALCLEPREGRLHVFLPPLTDLEHYLALVAVVEATAAETGVPVVLEGYEPPRDPRLTRLLVTPDPGVIEVNIHPSAGWRELVDKTQALYDEARLARLSTEKFMLDGRHTGTGGGNHITLGGPTPADSPLLRRPDLLRSLITYWQHHPGLSYLFSGMFIGPTSQAPRVDEGRDQALYELELAFRQIPKGAPPAPWLIDRLLRNLLIDVTGNTHRAEFCIDKLYSPDSATGRLGLLELRAFEMPPHAHMSLVQALLLRTLVARFWDQPYEHDLVRWNTELHDRFMLPHYVAADLREVVEELNQAGYAFDYAWLAPFLEFRFPHYGRVQYQNVELELRFAIEPWHVLGEEVSSGGTARFVDSSVERLQLKVTGLTDSRYRVTCNGRPVPLRNTGTRGEYVGGVRYRAWQPPSALHPTIGVHAPLVFDLVDLWNKRSIGGCTYHVAHPGGRHYETFPVNANEAEARRIARFWPFGHTGGEFDAQALQADPGNSPEYPYTLDLRLTS